MRTSGWLLATVAVVPLLAGCQSNTCQDLAEVYAEVAQKSQPCVESVPLPAFDPNRCEQNLQQCAGNDLEQLETQVECYQKLGTCRPEQKAVFLDAITLCDNYFISNTCEAAIF